jgi:hypothetical protein
MKTLIYSLLIICIFTNCKKENPEFIGKNKVTLIDNGDQSAFNIVVIFEDKSKIAVPEFNIKYDDKNRPIPASFSFTTDFFKFKLQACLGNPTILNTTDWINVTDTVILSNSLFIYASPKP